MSNTETQKILQNYADYMASALPDFKYFGAEKNIQDLARSLNQYGNNSILLTGPAGIGRRALISGFVQSLDADFMPIEMMNTNVYRINVQELFNTQNIANVEQRFDDVLEELKSIKARTGSKPVLVIDDGACFAKEVTERRASSILNKLKTADIASDDFDLILSLDNDAMHLMEKNHKNFLAHFTAKKVDTMNDTDVVAMLTHEAKRYAPNQLTIPEETTQKILELCKRYPALGDFAMPKSASVFMDEVATAYRIKMHSKPQGVVEQEAQIIQLQVKLEKAAENDASSIQNDIEQITACIAQSYTDWDQAKGQIKAVKAEVSLSEEANAKQQAKLERYQQDFLERSETEYNKLQHASDPRVTGITLEDFISTDKRNKDESMNGDYAKTRSTIENNNAWIKDKNAELMKAIKEMTFPITMPADFVDDYAKTKLGMNDVPDIRKLIRAANEHINGIVMGQDQMVNPMISAIKQRLSRKSEASKPMGVFLILGPSGVGKTYIAEVLSEELCGGKLSVINMEGFKEKHTVSRMIGAPPGYAGYDEKSELIKISEENPSGVILLDEIEKAHLDVKQALLTPLDKGKFVSANGKDHADFRDNIIIMTSNFGQNMYLEHQDGTFEDVKKMVEKSIYESFDQFAPEFLNRCTIVHANFLTEDIICKVVAKRVRDFAKEFVGEEGGFSVTMDQDSVSNFVKENYKKKNGARIVQKILEQQVGEYISDMVLENDAEDKNTCGVLKICYNDGGFTYKLESTSINLNADNENTVSESAAKPVAVANAAFAVK
jgi:ATP-dependent Clp protease ATP-binding subunit ClpB